MIRNQRPSIARGAPLGGELTKALEKSVPIRVIPKYISLLDSPADDVMQTARGVYACLAWHKNQLPHVALQNKT